MNALRIYTQWHTTIDLTLGVRERVDRSYALFDFAFAFALWVGMDQFLPRRFGPKEFPPISIPSLHVASADAWEDVAAWILWPPCKLMETLAYFTTTLPSFNSVYMELQNQTPEIHRERSSASISDYKFHAAVHTVIHSDTQWHTQCFSRHFSFWPSELLELLLRAERCLFGMGNTCTSKT